MATISKAPETKPGDILARVEEEGIEFIRFWFTDIQGPLKSFAVGKEELEGALEEGMGFDGSSITGFNAIEESDMIAMPDPDTYSVLPWRDRRRRARATSLGCSATSWGPAESRTTATRVTACGGRSIGRGDGLRHLLPRPRAGVLLLRTDEVGEDGGRRSSTRAATST